MANSIIMPKTGMAMEEGVIVEWRVKEGDTIAKGDVIAMIETDKTVMELESDYDGVILAILHQAGETVAVTKTIAWVGQNGEAIPESTESNLGNVGPQQKTPALSVASDHPQVTDIAPLSEVNAGGGGHSDKIKATPAAKALAKEKGIDLHATIPSGSYGEIKKADVQAAVSGNLKPVSLPPQPIVSGGRADTRVALTNIQKITGKRMSQSRQTIPEVTVHIKADVSRLLQLRQELNNTIAASGMPGKLSINDFVQAAVVKTLLAHPRFNSFLDGDSLVYKGNINLGMAVDTERGLLVPVIHNAQNYSLVKLASRAAELAAKARSGTLAGNEMSGGTFTVSNIGMYGVTAFTPIINPPEAAILGVCTIEDEVALEEGKVVVRKKLGLSLAFDHRIVDGAESAIFLNTLKKILEMPLLLLI